MEYSEMSKGMRRRLRELAEEAMAGRLHPFLQRLNEDFRSWERGEIQDLELDSRIGAFTRGPSRKLGAEYAELKPDILVAKAVALGSLDPEVVDEEILEILGPMIEGLRSIFAEDD